MHRATSTAARLLSTPPPPRTKLVISAGRLPAGPWDDFKSLSCRNSARLDYHRLAIVNRRPSNDNLRGGSLNLCHIPDRFEHLGRWAARQNQGAPPGDRKRTEESEPTLRNSPTIRSRHRLPC